MCILYFKKFKYWISSKTAERRDFLLRGKNGYPPFMKQSPFVTFNSYDWSIF